MTTSRAIANSLPLLFALAIGQTAAAPGALAQGAPTQANVEGGVFTDPLGRFAVLVPTNWNVELNENWITLIAPEEAIHIDIVVLQEATSEDALQAA